VTSEHEDQPEHEHGEGHVLLAEERQDGGHREPAPALVPGGPIGEQQRTDGDGVRMEELPREPLVGGVQQEGGGEGDTGPLRPEHVAGQQVQGDGPAGLGEHLYDEEEDGTGADPVEGHEEQQDEVGVVPEDLEAPDGHERVLEL